MIYFKKIELTDVSQGVIEKKIRAFSAKRHSALDLMPSWSYINEEKNFLGLESEKFIKIIRIRSPFERFLPGIIVRFNKDDFSFYKLRLSLFSFLISILLSLALVLNIIYSLINWHLDSDIASVIVVPFIYLILILIEIKLTNNKIHETINSI